MPRFVLTRKAKAEVQSIGRHTPTTWERDQRNRYLATLDKSFHELAANPVKGWNCGFVRPGYRQHRVGQHIVFYRPIADDCIEIVRVLHRRMDVGYRLSEPDAD